MTKTYSTVVITHAQPINLRKDYVSLPGNYGTPGYFSRPDVREIYRVVQENLTLLNARTHFADRLAGKRVFIKPNLVTVYSGMGLQERDYPESTDPRLLDALVAYFKNLTDRIAIVESSGRGVPTRGSYRVAGIDRLARHYGIDLIALEEKPTVRYLLPNARVQKEIIVPAIFDELIAGQAFYVTVPKMKTNLYTGVTLGFKNAMGLLPYNLRQRDHHFNLDQKLVDIMHLFAPDLTIVDGLVGAEGNGPAPVDPVDSRVLISGDNCLETDRVVARMMGFDPSSLPLIQKADEAGFNDPKVEIHGEESRYAFRQADPSLMSDHFHESFPNVQFLVGHQFAHSPRANSFGDLTPAFAREMEMGCRGGCLATTRFAFEMFEREGIHYQKPLVVVIGEGIKLQKETYYLDRTGNAYTTAEIASIHAKKLVIGTCARGLAQLANRFVDGCMPYPNSPHMALHQMTRTYCRVISFKNRHLLPLLLATFRTSRNRKKLLRQGYHLDCSPGTGYGSTEAGDVAIHKGDQAIIRQEWPPLSPDEIQELCAAENRAVLATFLG